MQPPISPILYPEVERGGEQGCFARDELGRQETTEKIKPCLSMITTIGIGEKGEGGLKTWFWTHEPIPSHNVQKKNLPKSTPFEHALHECPQMG